MNQKKVSKTFFKPKNNYEQVAQDVYDLLVENFSDTFFVGGMVRNLFWHKKITDIDIATSAKPEQVSKLLTKNGWRLDRSAIRFGVIMISYQKLKIEITTFRKEVYSQGRYPKITFTKSLVADSQRRDFTINSLYFHAKKHTVIDPHNGLQALRLRQLVCVGDAQLKFQEDPLRIIRAYRFQQQYHLTFSPNTAQALNANINLVHTLTLRRRKTEIEKNNSPTIKRLLTKKFL